MTTTVPDIRLHKPAITVATITTSPRRRSSGPPRKVLRMIKYGAEKIRSGTAARRPTIGPASSMRKFGRCSATRRQPLAHKPAKVKPKATAKRDSITSAEMTVCQPSTIGKRLPFARRHLAERAPDRHGMLKRRLTEATSSAVRYFDLIRVTAKHVHEGASDRSLQIEGMEVAKPPRGACDRGSAPGGGGDFRFVPAVADMAEIAGVARCSRHPGDRGRRPLQRAAGGGAGQGAASAGCA